MEKASLVFAANLRELDRIQALSEGIDGQMVRAEERIDACKQELAEAKQIRKHRQGLLFSTSLLYWYRISLSGFRVCV